MIGAAEALVASELADPPHALRTRKAIEHEMRRVLPATIHMAPLVPENSWGFAKVTPVVLPAPPPNFNELCRDPGRSWLASAPAKQDGEPAESVETIHTLSFQGLIIAALFGDV